MFAMLLTVAHASPHPVVTLPPLLNGPIWTAARLAEEQEMAEALDASVDMDVVLGELDVPVSARIVSWGVNVERFDGSGRFYYVVRIDREDRRPVRVRCRSVGDVGSWSFAPRAGQGDPAGAFASMRAECQERIDARLSRAR